MTIKLTRCIEFVPKRHAFKARFYNSVELKNWVDFGSVRKDFSYLSNNPREANSLRSILFIQPASDSSPSSFCAFSMASRNWLSNRIWKGVLLDFLLLSLLCIDIIIILNYYNLHVITLYVKSNCKTMPRSAGTLSRHLTINTNQGNAMANSNDTLYPENGQLDLSNLLSVLNLYKSNIPTSNLLQAKDHFEELQQSILCGFGAIGNLIFWACESEDYTEQNLKNDMRDMGYLLKQLKDVAYFALNQINQLDAEHSNKGGK